MTRVLFRDTGAHRIQALLPTRAGILGVLVFPVALSGVTAVVAATPTQSGDKNSIEEIVVTAQRRAEALQDVPIAITVHSGEQLEKAGITDLNDLTLITPGLMVSGIGANTQPVIRGIQSQQSDPGNDANVSVYLDGVYQPNHIANNFELPDVERVEVLKGPQGTLFGRNATGGAIRVFTLNPSFDMTGRVSLEYGRFDDVTGKAYVSGPLVDDRLAASLSVYRRESDGYHEDIGTNEDNVGTLESTTVRGKLLATPTDNSEILLTLAYVDRYDGGSTTFGARGGNALARRFLTPGAVIADEPHEFTTNRDALLESTLYSASLQAQFELPLGLLELTTAYNETEIGYTQDADFSSMDLLYYGIWQDQEDFSQEIIFSTEQFDRIGAVVGAFYYESEGTLDPTSILGPFAGPAPVYIFSRQETKAYAVFSEVTFDVTDRLSLTGGLRYSDETRRAYSTFRFGEGPDPDPPSLGKKNWTSVTPRVSLRYQITDDDNLYLTYSEGFKSGGYNLSTADPDPFDQEELKAIEVGFKSSPSRRVSTNVAAFYYDYTDQQVQALVDNFNVTANAASSEIYGADADVLAHITRDFTMTVGVSWLHAEYEDYPDAVALVPIGGAACRCGNTSAVIDATGFTAPQSPEWTLGLTANYTRDFSFGGIEATASIFHSDGFYWDINERVEEPSYTTLAAKASWRPQNSRFRVSLWGRNLTDETYTKNSFILEMGDGVTYARPRTYGIGMDYSF